ncbi:MAG TPA: DUF5681 domain-containing protein [Saprospiraceae bacterium]|mgnify:CR=1 FL=1|nr:DUF5681 domain-containing protein [Saprospiraceae bacterium]
MPFQPGISGNPEGRKPGTKNKFHSELKEIIHTILKKEIEGLPEQLDRLKPKDRLDIFIKLLPYFIPKYSDLEMNTGDKIQINIINRELKNDEI